MQLAFRDQVIPADSPEALTITRSREYGASHALYQLAQEIGLPKAIYSRNEPWVQSTLAMAIGRILYQGSKLHLTQQHENTALWELCGITEVPDVDKHGYLPLDKLLKAQKRIQKTLAKKHLADGTLLLYDITSTYLEGQYEESQIVKFGYNRDRKSGHKQVVIGLLCGADGCPIGCEVFEGNTNDATTVQAKIEEIRHTYGLKKVTLVGDRGMLTTKNVAAAKDLEGLTTISALTHPELRTLVARNVVQPELFDEHNIVEITDPEKTEERYCLCRNPHQAQESTDTRQRLIELTQEGLEKIADYKRASSVEELGARVGKLLAKYKMGKFFTWSVTPTVDAEGEKTTQKSTAHQLTWELKAEQVKQEQRLDGCYIIRTDVPAEQMPKDQVVQSYKSLGDVERAFRAMKMTHLEVRPVYHKSDDRIKAHIFLCMLAYYLQWHLEQKLAPLFEADGKGKDRKWSVRRVIDSLTSIRENEVEMQGVTIKKITQPTESNQTILDLLKT